MKVFIVTKEEYDYSYSDYAILRVFLDEKKAEDFRDTCVLIRDEYRRVNDIISQEMQLWQQTNPYPTTFLTDKKSKAQLKKFAEERNQYSEKLLAKRAELEKQNLTLSDEQKQLAEKYILIGYSSPHFNVLEFDLEE